ncbi:MAG TPA: ATP-binding protein [Polyangiaceae bacterium]|jgi:hypothetical protein
MDGVALARDWLLLGASSLLTAPRDQIFDAHEGFPGEPERWAALSRELERHLSTANGPLWRRLRETLALGDVGYLLVLLTAASEIYPEAAAAASILAEDERVQLVTPLSFARLARAALGSDFNEALREALPSGAARRLGLLEALEVAPGRPLTQQGLRLRPEELSALLGREPLGVTRATQVLRMPRASAFVYSGKVAQGAARLLGQRRLLVLRCESNRAGRQLAFDVAGAREQDALFVSCGESLPELSDLGRLRQDGTVVLDLCSWPNERPIPTNYLEAASALLPSLIALVAHQAIAGALPTFAVPAFGQTEARRVWLELVPDADDASWLATRFRLNLEQARLALSEARDAAEIEGESGPPPRARVTQAVLAQGSRRMGRAVSHVGPGVKLADLVVSAELARQVRDIIGWYAASARVEREYRVRSTGGSGPGLACLFSGQPGTGKTFAAQCIASELGLNLYRIDLAQVVSKYIGETEKSLAQVFEEAEAGHGVLLFDEADALFGKRTEVKDAHDRYANVEVGYLLQRMESFSGIAILTTNLRSNIDQAFIRRLKFVLEFPVPDAERRKELWERSLPAPHLRRQDLDLLPFIERFKLSGGLIHNIGLAASHLAAATADGLLAPEHVVQATYRELEKSGMSRSATDFGPLAHLLPARAS